MTEPIIITSYPELDALVAEHIFETQVKSIGDDSCIYIDLEGELAFVPKYSRLIKDSFPIAEKLRFRLIPREDGDWWCGGNTSVGAKAKTAPLAICLAALKSVGVEVEVIFSPP